MQKKEVYIFSGLGADERVFQYFDFSDYNAHFIKWISAYENEKIEDYAKRITNKIEHPFPIFIGLSFGGIMAIEVAKQVRTEKIIIIASAKNRKEIPFYYRLIGKLNLHKMLPSNILKKSNIIVNFLFGVYTPFEKSILKEILFETDSLFLKWAIDCIIKWKNDNKNPNVIHIHGTKDRLLPLSFIDSDYKIQNGGHLMTLSHSTEIMNILKREL